jgi:hypothetical protein
MTNREKYDFLMASAEKFTELATLLEEGQYTTIKGTSTIGDKLKAAGYDFFQESLKDNDDDFETQTETVVILPVPEEEPEEAEEVVEYEDISSSSIEESTNDNNEASFDEDTTDAGVETDAEESSDVDDEVVEEDDSIIEIPVEAEENDVLGRPIGDALCPEIGKDNDCLQMFKKSYLSDPNGGGT